MKSSTNKRLAGEAYAENTKATTDSTHFTDKNFVESVESVVGFALNTAH